MGQVYINYDFEIRTKTISLKVLLVRVRYGETLFGLKP
jgi:hypothetical protein